MANENANPQNVYVNNGFRSPLENSIIKTLLDCETLKEKSLYCFDEKDLYWLIDWVRCNGERYRGNLQKDGIELYKEYLKQKESWMQTR